MLHRTFVHIPKDERAKLDAKTKECIYLRSPKDEFGYRLQGPINKKGVHNKDIVFFEDQTIEEIKNSEKPRLRNSKNTELTPVRREDNDMIENSDAKNHEHVLEQNNQETHDEPAQEDPQSSSLSVPEPRRSSRER